MFVIVCNFLSDLVFQMLPNVMPKLSEVPVGDEDKNRYANVIPCKFLIFVLV